MSGSTARSRSVAPPALLSSPLKCELRWTTLTEALRAAAAEAPDTLYIDFVDGKNESHPRTYAEALAGAERFARRLLDRGLERGDRVGLLLPTSAEFVDALFGTLLAGGVPVPWPLPLMMGNLEEHVEGPVRRVFENSGARLLCTVERASELAGRMMEGLGKPDAIVQVDVDEEPSRSHELVAPEPDDLALLQYTSSQVTEPTGIALTHRQILSNVYGVGRALDFGPEDVGVSWIPMVHDMGLIGVLFTGLYWRYPNHVMPPEAFLMRPQWWIQNLSRFGATISAAPNFAYQLAVRRVGDRHLKDVDLSRWRLALNGAEQVHHETVVAFGERFASVGFDPEAVMPIYGLAENSLAATCPSRERSYQTAELDVAGGAAQRLASPGLGETREVVSVGVPIAGQSVRVVGPDGEVLAEDEIGEVQVQGPCLMNGYFQRPELNASVLVDGWLRTGDLGFVHDGRLHITGRCKEMVIKMGRNYFPGDVEEMLSSVPELDGAPVVAFPEQSPSSGSEDLVVVVGLAADEKEERKRLETAVNGRLLARLGIRADRIVLTEAANVSDAPEASLRRQAVRQALREERLG